MKKGDRVQFLLIMLLLTAMGWCRQRDTGFLDRSVRVDGVTYRYQVYVPLGYTKHQRWPVILFLHGVSQRGDDGLQPTDLGIAQAIREHRDRFPAIVVMPQARKGQRWNTDLMQKQALKALDASVKEFHGDPTRLYLTGMSMGGFGVWDMTAKYPHIFAAYVPICGGIHGPPKVPDARVTLAADPKVADPYAETARRIGNTPVWIFHGSDDPTVPVEESRKMAIALKAAGANFRYTEYQGAGHEIWDRAYGDPELMRWLLSQHLQ
ncbi:MAG TPA: prolyl oligopeptidase family serine peptidase [Acidobacteriaceae bacterium]|jgi:predicted peptidase|nr:prolyl oligopeptidase family serine peptidase [Acidobacteriaceae bacterium]